MAEGHTARRVGIFVAVGLVLLVLLLMSFSKSLSIFTPTYDV
jgi:hypothetical protein